MLLVNRKTVTRVSALILVLMLVLSSTACLAASFTKSAAGVKYNGKTVKLGATTSKETLVKVFGSGCRTAKVAVCGIMPYGGRVYKFASKGISIDTRYKNAKKTSEQVVTITLTKSTVPTLAGLKVGDTTSKLSQKYGKKCYVDYGNKNHVYYESGDYVMDVFTRSTKNSSGKKVNTITKLVFLIY